MILSAIIELLRPARTPAEGMRKAETLLRMARWLFFLNLFALAFTVTLIGLLRMHP